MAPQVSGFEEWSTAPAMNSYNRTNNGFGSERLDQSGLSKGNASAQISIATLKKTGPFPIDEVCLGFYCQSAPQTGSAGEKNSLYRVRAFDIAAQERVMRNHLLSKFYVAEALICYQSGARFVEFEEGRNVRKPIARVGGGGRSITGAADLSNRNCRTENFWQ